MELTLTNQNEIIIKWSLSKDISMSDLLPSSFIVFVWSQYDGANIEQ